MDAIVADPSVADLKSRIAAQGLGQNVRELDEMGYTVFHDDRTDRIVDEVRSAIIRNVPAEDHEKAPTRFTILGEDPVFAEAITTPRLLTLVEYLLGKGALFSQLSASRRRQGKTSLGLHADNSWFPAPFPEWEISCTACLVTDEFTQASGATLIVPGTHKLRRHPNGDDRTELKGAQPIIAAKGAICLWDGSVWHGNYPRELPGERIVLHMTYTRIGMHPIENYDHLDEDWLADKDPELPRLLGREIFLGRSPERKQNHRELLKKTYDQVHGPGFR